MRLYLSSYGLGERPERLAALVGERREGLIIRNALDHSDDVERRRDDLEVQRAGLASIGLRGVDFDLREHGPASVRAALADAGFVWVRGGNVFVLRMAMARSSFDEAIRAALADDALVYAGFSAGPCVLAPSLRGLELCDPVADAQRLYGQVRYDGLGVLDRPVVPHLESVGHPESNLLGRVARRYVAAGRPFHPLRDGEVLIIED